MEDGKESCKQWHTAATLVTHKAWLRWRNRDVVGFTNRGRHRKKRAMGTVEEDGNWQTEQMTSGRCTKTRSKFQQGIGERALNRRNRGEIVTHYRKG